MKRAGLDEGEAFGRLQRTASERNLKLVETARMILVAEEALSGAPDRAARGGRQVLTATDRRSDAGPGQPRTRAGGAGHLDPEGVGPDAQLVALLQQAPR